jgi:hypothetical protein
VLAKEEEVWPIRSPEVWPPGLVLEVAAAAAVPTAVPTATALEETADDMMEARLWTLHPGNTTADHAAVTYLARALLGVHDLFWAFEFVAWQHLLINATFGRRCVATFRICALSSRARSGPAADIIAAV